MFVFTWRCNRLLINYPTGCTNVAVSTTTTESDDKFPTPMAPEPRGRVHYTVKFPPNLLSQKNNLTRKENSGRTKPKIIWPTQPAQNYLDTRTSTAILLSCGRSLEIWFCFAPLAGLWCRGTHGCYIRRKYLPLRRSRKELATRVTANALS